VGRSKIIVNSLGAKLLSRPTASRKREREEKTAPHRDYELIPIGQTFPPSHVLNRSHIAGLFHKNETFIVNRTAVNSSNDGVYSQCEGDGDGGKCAVVRQLNVRE
jgi:hypothetical protein